MKKSEHTPQRTALSVNVNKVALVRNTRHLGIPSVTRAATLCTPGLMSATSARTMCMSWPS